MVKCKNCHEERKFLKEGICLVCRSGPGGKPVKINVPETQYKTRGKIVKTSFSSGNS